MSKQINQKQAKKGAIVALCLFVLTFIGYWFLLAGPIQNYTATNRVEPNLLLCVLGAVIAGLGLSLLSFVAGSLGALFYQKYADSVELNWLNVFKAKAFYSWSVAWIAVWLLLTLIWRGQAW